MKPSFAILVLLVAFILGLASASESEIVRGGRLGRGFRRGFGRPWGYRRPWGIRRPIYGYPYYGRPCIGYDGLVGTYPCNLGIYY